MGIAQRLAGLALSVDKIRKNAPMAAPQVAVLGAAKGQTDAIIEEAIKAGLILFGENRVQEAEGKWPDIKKRYPNVKLHLIGPLQTNKTKEALLLFDVIQTLDREKLADEIAKLRDGGMNLDGKTFFIQVNTGKESQKAGVIPEEADAFITYCKNLKLPIAGLMCVPPEDQPAAPHFALLHEIAKRHGLKELSMGMSGDYETAIRMGSTCVRIGTALFGARS